MIDRRMQLSLLSSEMSAMVMMMIIITVVSKDRMKENGQPTFNY